MKSYDFEAVTFDGGVYCIGCLETGTSYDDTYPIFADSEWDSAPVCDTCGAVHDYVNVLASEDEDEEQGEDDYEEEIG